MWKNFCLSLALVLASAQVALANKVVVQQARNEYVTACINAGGLKEICTCGFAKIEPELQPQELLDLSQSITSGIPPNELHIRKLAKATSICAKELKNKERQAAYAAQFAPTQSAASKQPPKLPPSLPSLTPPPSLPKLEDSPTEAADIIDLNEPALQDQPKADEPPVSSYTPKKLVYKGEYDGLFFNSVLKEDLKAMSAVADVMDNIDIINAEGNTPLMEAIKYGKVKSFGFLLSRGASAKARNLAGQTPLHLAIYYRQPAFTAQLVEAGADVNAVYEAGFNPLALAIMSNDYASLNLLLAHRAKPNALMPDGNSAIHVAAALGNTQAIEMLASYKSNMNLRSADGFTPLMVAAAHAKADAAQALIRFGADPSITDPAGRTASIIAQNVGAR